MTRPMITSFSGPYAFLSNFYTGTGSDVTIKGIHYPTTEHAFQAGKFLDPEIRATVASCATPGDSKRYARKLASKIGAREGWKDADISIHWMLKCIRLKFQHPELKAKLVATGKAGLIEGNIWGDNFWGMIRVNPDEPWVGENWLGKILEHVRRETVLDESIAFDVNAARRLAALFK